MEQRPSSGVEVIGMVHNRLTDFYLTDPGHSALKSAYDAGAVVMSRHPRIHALQVEKRNMVALSDPALLISWRVSDSDRALLAAAVPQTVQVTPERAEELWAQRRQWCSKSDPAMAARLSTEAKS
ncbi:MAG: hypothetical protein ACWGIK_16680 [Achromobacter pulmonis]